MMDGSIAVKILQVFETLICFVQRKPDKSTVSHFKGIKFRLNAHNRF